VGASYRMNQCTGTFQSKFSYVTVLVCPSLIKTIVYSLFIHPLLVYNGKVWLLLAECLSVFRSELGLYMNCGEIESLTKKNDGDQSCRVSLDKFLGTIC
jgi:hypothetical protein